MVYDDSWVCGDAVVSGNAIVCDDTRVYGDAWVYGNAIVRSNTIVYGNARVYGNTRVHGDAWVYGNAIVCGDTIVYDNARVYGDSWVCGDAECTTSCFNTYIDYFQYNITMTDYHIRIGCIQMLFAEWLEVGIEDAVKMGLKREVYKPLRKFLQVMIPIHFEKPLI
jgi:UDP-3-O-[3-hydroxymyristoyl] glucosamine N-acyltransferase